MLVYKRFAHFYYFATYVTLQYNLLLIPGLEFSNEEVAILRMKTTVDTQSQEVFIFG